MELLLALFVGSYALSYVTFYTIVRVFKGREVETLEKANKEIEKIKKHIGGN